MNEEPGAASEGAWLGWDTSDHPNLSPLLLQLHSAASPVLWQRRPGKVNSSVQNKWSKAPLHRKNVQANSKGTKQTPTSKGRTQIMSTPGALLCEGNNLQTSPNIPTTALSPKLGTPASGECCHHAQC